MRLGKLGISSDEELREQHDEQVREARIKAARRVKAWTELPEPLVPRGRYRVSAGDDSVYRVARGAIFAHGSANVIAERSPIYFVVGPDGGLSFYERAKGTWSEMVERTERRRLGRERKAAKA